jgi:hypothetical protein
LGVSRWVIWLWGNGGICRFISGFKWLLLKQLFQLK